MTRELIAQAEALEWAQTLNWKDYDDLAMQLMRRAQELRAQAEQPAEPVARVVSFTNGSYWRNYTLEWMGEANVGDKLYLRPDPRIAALEGLTNEVALIRSVLNGYPQSMARADALRAVERIEAALGKEG